MSNIDLPVLCKPSLDGTKRLRRVVPLVAAAALSAALVAAAAGPASAAVREPARTAPISFASSDNGLSAGSLTTAARYVSLSDGRFTFDTVEATKAGVGSQALRTEIALVASMNKLLDRRTATANNARVGVDAAKVVPAAAQDTTITVLPGITLTINSTEIQLSMSKQAVTEIENVVGFGQTVASLVGSILAVIPVYDGGAIAGIVAAALGLFNSGLKLCTAPDGSATFTIPWPGNGLPSCSGLSLVA